MADSIAADKQPSDAVAAIHQQAEGAVATSTQALQALYRVALEFGAERELPVLMRRIMENAVELLNADRGGGIYLYEPEQAVLRLVEGSGINEGRTGIVIEPQQGVTGRVYQTAQPLIVNDYAHWAGQATVLAPDPPSAVMGVPLFVEGRAIGVLAVFANSLRRTFGESDVRLAEMFAAQAALAIHNAWLHEQARQEIAQRQAAEESLRSSEAKYRHLVDNSLQGMVIFQEGRLVFANAAMSSIVGYSVDEILAMSPEQIVNLVHPADREWVTSNIRQRLNGLPVKPYNEHRIVRADGQIRTVELYASLTTYRDKPAIQGTYLDITARKQAEEAYHTLVEYSLQGLAIFQGARNVFVNSRVCDMLGYSAEELYAMEDPITAYVHPDDHPLVMDELGRVLGGQGSADIEVRVITKQGQEGRIRALGTRVLYQGEPAIQAAMFDITEHSRISDLLRQLSQAVEQSPASIVIADKDANIEYVNPKFTEVTGYTFEEVLNHNPRILKTGFTSPEEYQKLWDTISSGGIWRGEFLNRKKDGKTYWESASITGVRDERGQITHYVAVKEDITERKQAEEQLELLKHSIDVHYDGAYWMDSTNKFVYVNDGGCQALGYYREELIGMALETINPRATPDTLKRLWERLRKDGFASIESVHRRKDGSEFPVEIVSTLVRFGGREYNCGFARDITDRKRAEEQLRRSEAALSKAQQVSQVGSWTWDIKTNQLEWSDEMYHIFGLEKAGFSGSLEAVIAQAIHPEDRAKVEQANLSVINEQRLVPLDYRVIWPDRSVHTVWAEAGELKVDEDGRPTLLTGIVQDITERKQAEQELEQYREHLEELVDQRTAELQVANERLRVLSRIKDEFVSNVSHELRTPITNLKLREYLIEIHPDQFQDHLPVMKRETDRLMRTIEDLLQLSRLDQGRIKLSIAPVDLNLLVGEYVSDRTSLADSRNLALSFHGDTALPDVLVDTGLLGQVLSILMTNAMNYTPPGGRIAVQMRYRQTSGGEWVGFSVADTGPGISREEIPELFTRFFRGKVGRGSGMPGTGLGLAIAKEIVERHGGEIELKSEGLPGRGTTFTVWIPVNDPLIRHDG